MKWVVCSPSAVRRHSIPRRFPRVNLNHRGRKGDAWLFSNVDAATRVPDPLTLHAGTPPTNGEKWIFSQWIRDRHSCSGGVWCAPVPRSGWAAPRRQDEPSSFQEDLLRRLVSQPFLAAADRLLLVASPFFPPFRAEALLSLLPRPEPDLFPPPLSLLTVAQSLIVYDGSASRFRRKRESGSLMVRP